LAAIAAVRGRQILDSRGRPTVEVDVTLVDGAVGRASVPSGASIGSYEAHERRDGDESNFAGLGVLKAVAAVQDEIEPALRGQDSGDQRDIDALLRALDGTDELSRLGANAVLGTSLAVCRAAAGSQEIPLYRYIAELAGVQTPQLPLPMVNILSGGLHARRGMDVQDFLVVPVRANTMPEALHIASRVRAAADVALAARGLPTLLADEGGLSPGCKAAREALELMIEIIERADLEPGRDAAIAIDVAAHSLVDEHGRYVLAREGLVLSSGEMIDMVAGWVREFPVVSVEDALDEEDWSGWTALTSRLGGRTRLVGDDLFVTNANRLRHGITSGAANALLIKINQNGTLSGALDVLALAQHSRYLTVVSARSGETEDAFIADLAVGTAAGQIKIGSLRCSDRLTKYNQLLRLAEEPDLTLTHLPLSLG
jgi:enolase